MCIRDSAQRWRGRRSNCELLKGPTPWRTDAAGSSRQTVPDPARARLLAPVADGEEEAQSGSRRSAAALGSGGSTWAANPPPPLLPPLLPPTPRHGVDR